MKAEPVQAFCCPLCHELYILSETCNLHIVDCEAKRAAKIAEEERKANHLVRYHQLRQAAESFQDIARLLEIQVQNEFGVRPYFQLKGNIQTTTYNPRSIMIERPITRKLESDCIYSLFTGTLYGQWKEPISLKDSYYNLMDFISNNNAGIRHGSGSASKNNFQYGIRLFLDDFPKIKEKFEEFLFLEKLEREHSIKMKNAQAEYEEYLSWKAFADPVWAVHNQELKELEERKIELIEILKVRKQELDDERKERTHVPLPENLSLERLRELHNLLN